MGGIFLAVKNIEIMAALTIAMSAMLKTGQLGSCNQSIT
jgi:hypothetical protein